MRDVRQIVFGALVALVIARASRDISNDGRMLASALALGCVVLLLHSDPASE